MLRSADGIVLSKAVRQNGRDLAESYYVRTAHGPSRVPFADLAEAESFFDEERRCAYQQLRSWNSVCRRGEDVSGK